VLYSDSIDIANFFSPTLLCSIIAIIRDTIKATLVFRQFVASFILSSNLLLCFWSLDCFFIQIAKIWREKKRKEDLMQLLENMPHPNGEYRVNGTLKNIDAFHELFNTKPGDKMYRKPSERVKLW